MRSALRRIRREGLACLRTQPSSSCFVPFNRAASTSIHPSPVSRQSPRGSVLSYAGTAIVSVLALAWALQSEHHVVRAEAEEGGARAPSKRRTIARKELAEHDTEDSAWVAIEGQVLDVTTFLAQHPGGRDILLQHAGQDVTEVFNGIHPRNTLEKNWKHLVPMGVMEVEPESQPRKDEAERIRLARQALPDLSAVFCIQDFEDFAKSLCSEAAWDYFRGAGGTETSLRGNAAAFDRVYFRPRVMRDVREIDITTTVLSYDCVLPVFVSPTARNGLAQSLGEIAVTRGAGSTGILQVLSHVASKSVEDVMAERAPGQQVACQIYMHPDRKIAESDIRRAVKAGAQSIWLTVDTVVPSNHIAAKRNAHARKPIRESRTDPAAKAVLALSHRHDAGITWDDVKWIKSIAPGLPIVIKGIGAWEDALLASEHGADAVLLSNHGGRALDYSNAPLKTLKDINQNCPELVKRKDFEIYVDGGLRSGTDIAKAICLGANAVGLGRPFIWAASGWGQQGVEKAITLLRWEFEQTMRYLGVTRLEQLGPHLLDVSAL